MRNALIATALLACVAVSTPATADVKAGVDAWARGDYRQAIEQWRDPAAAGDADAQFNLGQAYKLGRGVNVDLKVAEEWYRKAAVQGHPQAGDNYGLALFQNNKRDRAVPWLEKSVARGEPRAQYVLGTMYFNADVVKRDWVRAYALMTRASSAGLPQANATLAQMNKYIGLPDRQRGTELARRYEREIGRPPMPIEYAGASQPARPVGTAKLPPSRTVDGPIAMTRPQPKPRAPAQVAAAAPASGAFRVQLGAFRDPDGARRLWSQFGSRFPGRQPYFVKAGTLTKLLVGPFASQAEAARACGSVSPCVPTRG